MTSAIILVTPFTIGAYGQLPYRDLYHWAADVTRDKMAKWWRYVGIDFVQIVLSFCRDARPTGQCKTSSTGGPCLSPTMWPNDEKASSDDEFHSMWQASASGYSVLLRQWYAESSVCGEFSVGISCGMLPTYFFRHTKKYVGGFCRFLQHITVRTSLQTS